MKPREIPFERCVLPMVDDPLEMRWRLDFADWLYKNGYKERAHWFKYVCAHTEFRTRLPEGSPWPEQLNLNGPDKNNRWFLDKWLECRPEYWNEIDRALGNATVSRNAYYGRVIISAGAFPENHYSLLGQIDALIPAFRDGWLERLDCMLFHTDQVDSLLAWPESHRALPLHIDTLRCQSEGPFDERMHKLLCFESLHGLTLAPGEIACSCMKRFGDLAKNLRYLLLLGLRKTGPSLRILEHLRHLPELRSLTIGQNLPTDDQIEHLTAIPKLQRLYLCGRDLTDKGLLAVGECRSLRMVYVTSERVTRAGFYALREARPDLRVFAIDDAFGRLGPV